MADITITVTGTPPTGTYSPAGPIVVNPGTTTIQFQRGSGQSWAFETPYFTTSPSGPFTITSASDSQVTITDTDPGGTTVDYEYTLYTTEGPFDPEIINKG